MGVTVHLQQSEDQFQSAVIAWARMNGWMVAHFRPARTADGGWRTAVAGDGKGFPDLVLVRNRELIFAELKAEKGLLSMEQTTWLHKLDNVAEAVRYMEWPEDEATDPAPRVEVHVWRPSDWQAVEERLRRG